MPVPLQGLGCESGGDGEPVALALAGGRSTVDREGAHCSELELDSVQQAEQSSGQRTCRQTFLNYLSQASPKSASGVKLVEAISLRPRGS